MRLLYIFPHPDDESFGPALAISKQIRSGDKVFLLTLTKGGATKQRHKFGYSIEQMGEVRHKEMLEVEKTLGLAGMTVLDLPDSGLKEIDPRIIENAIKEEINSVKPDIIITYAVHGISGFHDHLVSHAVVKRVYCELKDTGNSSVKRLALFTLTEKTARDEMESPFRLSGSTDDEIDCIIQTDNIDAVNLKNALMCYETYKDVIRDTKIIEQLPDKVCFEFFQENFNPAVTSLSEGL